MKEFEVLMNLLISGEKICKKLIYNRSPAIFQVNFIETTKEDVLVDGKTHSRKAKRRTKALKAKIAKFKTAELTERLNNSTKKSQESEQPNPEEEPKPQTSYEPSLPSQSDFAICDEILHIPPEVKECDIVNALKTDLLIGAESESEIIFERSQRNFSYARFDWKNKILSMPFNIKPKIQINTVDSYEEDFYLKPDDFNIFNRVTIGGNELYDESLEALLYPCVRYLSNLLNKVVNRYKQYWMIDNQLEKEIENNNLGECL